MDNEESKKLINKYLGGDTNALQELINQNLKTVYNFIYYFIGNQHKNEIDDITQETFVKVWRHLKKFDQNRNFKTWLLTIAKNTTLDFLKKKKYSLFSDFDKEERKNIIEEMLVDPEPLPNEILEKKDLANKLNSKIQQLSPRQRIILYLYYYQHFNFQEISDILNESINTVKSLHRRGIIKLRELLEKE